MSKIKKLIIKAGNSPKNITFDELCKLFEHYGFIVRSQEGSHIIYKHPDTGHLYPVQNGSCGKAKEYQVNYLIDWIDDNIKKKGK